MSIGFFLTALSGLAWTIVYIDGIRIGIKDKSFAMPLWPLGLNIAWELLYFIIGVRHSGFSIQVVINLVWFLLDLGLVYTYFRYGRKYFPQNLKPAAFLIWGIFVIAVSFVVQYAFILEFEGIMGGTYAAYLQNLLMSVLFIHMLVQRGSREGQTMLIAVSKFIGSLAPTISAGILGTGHFTQPVIFVAVIGALMAVFDLIYIVMLARASDL